MIKTIKALGLSLAPLLLGGVGGGLSSCQREDFNDGPTAPEAKLEIAFNTTVSSNRQSTRADVTIVNMGETRLLPTATSKRKVGIFGCYTGKYTWKDLVTLSGTNFADADRATKLAGTGVAELAAIANETEFTKKKTDILNKYYSANLMFNTPATINDDGSLSYLPLQFWSNNPLPGGTEHEYMTFWAYYPFNESSTLGEYGISIFNDENSIGPGKGMGKVKFTMHADASRHNDFLISAPVTDCNRDKYPLQRTDNTPTYDPTPVQFRLYHMLAQVRFYVFINGNDKMVYEANVATTTDLARDDTNVKQKDLDNNGTNEPAVMNELGEWVELKEGDQIPDESKCVRWKRSDVWNLNHTSRRPEITYTMELNNIHTTATFYPRYTPSGATIAYDDAVALGSTTVNNYFMNPYWFTFKDGVRERLNDNYMFGFYEDTPVAKHYDATTNTGDMSTYSDVDGIDWSKMPDDPLDYFKSDPDKEEALKNINETLGHKHYNFAPGNVILVVPQTLSDDDVPHVVITAHGNDATTNAELTAKVTVNLLKMGISWESGYIYCYAFLDELRPGDDKVRGPESITTLINKEWYTDQW